MENADVAASNGNGDNPGYRLFGSLADASLIQQRRNGEDPDRADTLPRVKVRAMGHSRKLIDPSSELQELYDPDSVGKAFYHPAEEVNRFAYVPVRTKSGQYIDPVAGMKHRIQLVDHFEKGEPVLKEHWVETGKQLADLAVTPEYRRSRILESTGDWVFNGDAAHYVKAVVGPLRECYHESAKPLAERKLREAAGYDPFAFGDNDGGHGVSVTAAMDQEFIPIQGGCFTGDTRVALLDGTTRSFTELAEAYGDGTPFWVYAVTLDGQIVPGQAHHPRLTHRDAETLEIELDNGEKARCTPDHKWLKRDGTYCRADELAPGTSLMPLYRKESEQGLLGYELLFQPYLNRHVYTHKAFTGRVPKKSVVHHVNFNKRDNRPDNLQVMTRTDHQTLHMVTNARWWNDSIKKAAAVKKISAALKRNNWTQTPEGRAHRSAEMKARFARGWRPKHLGRIWDTLTLEQQRAIADSPLRKQRMREAYKNKVWTKEERDKISASVKAYHAAHPEYAARARESLARGVITQWGPNGTRKRKVKVLGIGQSEGSKRAWADPEKRTIRIAAMKAAAARPEERARKSEAMQKHRAGLSEQQLTNHKVIAVRQCGRADVYDLTVEKYHNFALAAGAFVSNSYFKQLYLYAHWEASAKCFEMKNHSELAKSTCDIVTDFALGRGVTWKIRNESARLIWTEFWERNHMEKRLRQFCSDSVWQGELLVRKDEVLKGFLRVRSIDPSAIYEIVTNVEDIEQVYFYQLQYPTLYQLPYSDFKGQHLDIPLQKYVIQQLPPTEVWHGKLNVTAYEKWGRSDYFCALGTLKRLRDWTNAATLRDLLQANLVWKMKIHGDDSDVQAFVNDPANSQLPPFAGTWVENDGLDLEPMHVDVATGGRGMGQGSVGNFLIALYAASQHFPSSYFNLQSSGMARATALVASEPVSKKIATRQQFLRELLDHLYEEVLKRAIEAGRVSADLLGGDDADPEWTFPGTFEEDRGAKFRDVGTAVDRRAISHRRAATVMSQELGFEEYDYDEEQVEIGKDLKNPNLQAPLLPVEPPVPAKPGFGDSGAPATAGGREDIKGADANMQARRNSRVSSGTGATPPVREAGRLRVRGLSEADRSRIRDAVRSGVAGTIIVGQEEGQA